MHMRAHEAAKTRARPRMRERRTHRNRRVRRPAPMPARKGRPAWHLTGRISRPALSFPSGRCAIRPSLPPAPGSDGPVCPGRGASYDRSGGQKACASPAGQAEGSCRTASFPPCRAVDAEACRPPAPPPLRRLDGKIHKGRFSSCSPAGCRLNTAPRRAADAARRQWWPVRLSVRTSGFQPEKRGSTPLRAATLLLTSR